jgi:hypothetical protein
MENLALKPLILLSLEDNEQKNKKLLKQIDYRGFKGWSLVRYNSYVESHKFFQDYDRTAELR